MTWQREMTKLTGSLDKIDDWIQRSLNRLWLNVAVSGVLTFQACSLLCGTCLRISYFSFCRYSTILGSNQNESVRGSLISVKIEVILNNSINSVAPLSYCCRSPSLNVRFRVTYHDYLRRESPFHPELIPNQTNGRY